MNVDVNSSHQSPQAAVSSESDEFNLRAIASRLRGNVAYLYCSSWISVGAESQNDSSSANEIDEDIAVTQSQRNFICPITQREMECPVKNKVCGHSYEEEAIIKIIQNKHKQKKKARCPVVGCDNGDMNQCDLSMDTALRRAIENHKKHQVR
ncbi:E3 SUMO-protein ligase NSE2 [Rhincodon typus]|uniref:E3 SUMO-protein ligase NSE2 n=1 Tax=Rhincodon typus TaxID=259920 RepID=UPI00202E4082|nr:E3 SUMO-protein ligase NSE2 [Rhincodon typus]